MTTRGKFIVIEGGEGAGKGTQLMRIAEQFPAVARTREPGGSPYAEEIRRTLFEAPGASDASGLTQFHLFWAARADHMEKRVTRHLLKGQHVLSDRGDASTYAYQVVAKQHEQLDGLFWVMRELHFRELEPDLYIWLDVTPKVGLARTKGRYGNNHHDTLPLAFHERVRQGYQRFFSSVETPHVHIDADQDTDIVWRDINSTLVPLLG